MSSYSTFLHFIIFLSFLLLFCLGHIIYRIGLSRISHSHSIFSLISVSLEYHFQLLSSSLLLFVKFKALSKLIACYNFFVTSVMQLLKDSNHKYLYIYIFFVYWLLRIFFSYFILIKCNIINFFRIFNHILIYSYIKIYTFSMK